MSLVWRVFCLKRHIGSPLAGDLTGDSETYWLWSQQLVKEGWLGQNPFFLGPLYPYWLALWRSVGGDPYLMPLLVQCVLGSVAVVFIALSARSLCSPTYALIAGLLAAGCGMATLMDISILTESLLWSLGAIVLCLQVRYVGRLPMHLCSVATGVLVGLMVLGRPSFILLLAPHVVASAQREGLRRGCVALIVAAGCAMCVQGPVLARHLHLGYGWITSTYSLGYNAYVGNGPAATGAYVAMLDEMGSDELQTSAEGGIGGDGRAVLHRLEHVQLSPRESSDRWMSITLAHIAESPSEWLRLLLWKAALSVNSTEMSQIDSLRLRERIEGPFGLPLLGGFGLIGSLGLFGLFAARRQPAGRILIGHALAVWAPLLLFFVTDRYRHHLTLPLLVACGPALQTIVDTVRQSGPRSKRALLGLLALLATAGLVLLPLVRTEAVQVEFGLHRVLGETLIKSGRVLEGERELEKCLEPGLLARLPLQGSAAARSAVGDVLRSLASSLAAREEYNQSEQALRAALAYAPHVRATRLDHAVLLSLVGRPSEARSQLDTLGLPASTLMSRLLLMVDRASTGSDWIRAERALRAALAIDSTSEPANVILLRLLVLQGRDEEARRHFAGFAGRGISASVRERETGPWLTRGAAGSIERERR